MIKSYNIYRGAKAPASTHHRLLLAVERLQMPFQPRRPPTQKCFNVESLCQDSGISMKYAVEIANHFQAPYHFAGYGRRTHLAFLA